MNSFLITAVSILSVGGTQVQLKDGRTIEGGVVRATQETVVVEAPGEQLRLSRDEVRNVVVAGNSQDIPRRGLFRLQLRDDSVLFAKTIRINGNTAVVSTEGIELTFPVAQIHYVRFGVEEDKDERWIEILARDPTADSIVVQGPDELESLEGVLGDVSATHVTFEFDGDSIDVKRKKVEGFIFYAARKVEYPQAPCIVHTGRGSRLRAESLNWTSGESCSITTQNGIPISLPAEAIQRIEYFNTNTVFLSDLEPENFSWRPAFFVGSPLPELEALYRPTRDVSFLSEPLVIRPRQADRVARIFKKGISMTSQTKVTYRLAGEFRRFQALAGIDEAFLPQGNVVLRLMGDGNLLFSAQISGTSDAIGIDVDLVSVKRLTIEVDFGDNSSSGDHLNLCNARLSK